MSIADEIARLHELLEKGALTNAEFERVKARLIGGADAEAAGGFAINRLRRSETDRWIAGVCGGLGRLTGLESWVWRILFVLGLVLGGFTLFAYVVLWIFVPRER
ncbi:MAG TPA: PspC domain-containing protein [Burkholderiales bacterium]|nr:PspC domain-containing protein [Burkholderiales bacterium]